jgi:hypothetical protein
MDDATKHRLYNDDHLRCLTWFEERSGTTTRWPKPIRDKIVLVTQYKGIFKPKWMPYVLSVRSSPKGPYADSPVTYNDDGSWSFRYAREENKGRSGDSLFTNKALQACMDDRIPVGVLYKESERSPYLVVGLGLPMEFQESYFLFKSYSPDAESSDADGAASSGGSSGNSGFTPGKAGYLADTKVRIAVESHAVKLAIAHYTGEGYNVTEVGKPYDLCAVKDGEELHVEVKGSTQTANDVELTKNEVHHARAVRTDLYVVDQIEYGKMEDGSIRTRGGCVRMWAGWQPATADLTPSRYRYMLPDG